LPAVTCRSPAVRASWIHEIKHDGYHLMAQRDPVGIRLTTRRGNDWTTRFPLVVEAVNHLKLRSCGRNHGRSAASSMNAG
jgi:bifunctional non-homologous end joining protein LigD